MKHTEACLHLQPAHKQDAGDDIGDENVDDEDDYDEDDAVVAMIKTMMMKTGMIMKPTTFCSVPVKGSLPLESRLDLLFDNLCWIKWD